MARQNGVWVEHTSTDNAANSQILRVHSSELKALRSAVDSGNGVTFLEFGETLADGIRREGVARTKARPDTLTAAADAITKAGKS